MTDPTPRKAMTPNRRARIFLACNGRCVRCDVKLTGEWEADHAVSLFSGGRDDDSNLVALCVPCHRQVKTPADAAKHAKIRRLRRKHGLDPDNRKPRKPIPSRPFQAGHRPIPSRPFPKRPEART